MSSVSGSKASGTLLTVSGAKFSQRSSTEDAKEKHYFLLRTAGEPVGSPTAPLASSMKEPSIKDPSKVLYSSASSNRLIRQPSPSEVVHNENDDVVVAHVSQARQSLIQGVNNEYKYWKFPPTATNNLNHFINENTANTNPHEDLVVIHVCDENQQISKDFCCKREVLVQHMRYFQKFLNENENGYDDIDISVHCDVEIFEWLMNYIHEPLNPPKMDKSILISILISSEFLQMDPLVELCITQVAQNLNEIIKLPIDLSCISEKLINRIAMLTNPKTLTEIKDRKDKILTKLYKRRVELDFSRKGSTAKSNIGNTVTRTIAASLTCCRYCGSVYLENFSSFLTCRKSPPSIDYRGRLASRHSAIPIWSLTSYLKTLHAGGMGWDSIYWHVWAACIVLRVEDVVISAFEVDRYTVEPDGLLIKRSVDSRMSNTITTADTDTDSIASSLTGSKASAKASTTATATSKSTLVPEFSLDSEVDSFLGSSSNRSTIGVYNSNGSLSAACKMNITRTDEYNNGGNGYSSSLNPLRPPEILTTEIFDLICSQMKYILSQQHKVLIASTMQNIVNTASAETNQGSYTGELQAIDDEDNKLYYGINTEESEKRRGRSPGRGGNRIFSSSLEPRIKPVAPQKRSSTVGPPLMTAAAAAVTAAAAANAVAAAAASQQASSTTGIAADTDSGTGGGVSTPYDSDADNDSKPMATATGGPPVATTTLKRATRNAGVERRSRSSSTGKRVSTASSSVSSKGLLPPRDPKAFLDAKSLPNSGIVAQESSDVDPEEAEINKLIEVLKSLPPDLHHKSASHRGPMHGIWMTPCPLLWQPAGFDEALQVVADSSIPDNKKLEWEMDLMREYDERRMDKLERWLMSKRNPAFDQPSFKATAKGGNGKSLTRSSMVQGKNGGGGGGGGIEYYKDRGRQPARVVI